MVPLRLGERLALALFGVATCAAALAFSIDDARGAAGNAPPDAPGPHQRHTAQSRDVLPARDPFGGDPALVAAAQPSPPASSAPIPPALPAVTPPPPAAFTLGTTAPRVSATVTGARPFAVLDGSAGARASSPSATLSACERC